MKVGDGDGRWKRDEVGDVGEKRREEEEEREQKAEGEKSEARGLCVGGICRGAGDPQRNVLFDKRPRIEGSAA
ncbi:hypothetical protein TWF730_008595 [Orbilia blumenaviensis]|uniref:Uncharacterized protein n=1 Tax=Orbilia blumenaviensis TaxID=1796055 RepID=A0AAV9V345_9PEZI